MGLDYKQTVDASMARYTELRRQIEALSEEADKLFQFIKASAALLPEDQKAAFHQVLDKERVRKSGIARTLTGTITCVLQSNKNQWFSAAQMRDLVVREGFDFSTYKSNPLASVSTTLRRLAENERTIETQVVENTTMYRWASATAAVRRG